MADTSTKNEELLILRKRLQRARGLLNLTYQQLADKTGMSKSTLQRYEKGGINNLPYDKILVLAEALEVPVSYFIDLDKDVTVPLSSDETNEVKDEHEPDLSYRKSSLNSPEARRNLIQKGKEFEKLALEHLAPTLLGNGYGIGWESPGSLGDIVATKGKEVWHIGFKYINEDNDAPRHFMLHHSFLRLMGRVATYKGRVTKYSILFNIDGIGDQLLEKYSLKNLNVDVSLLYLTDDNYREVTFNK